jgi:hypothetical protein
LPLSEAPWATEGFTTPPRCFGPLMQLNGPFWFFREPLVMKKLTIEIRGEKVAKAKPSHSQELRRIIEEYANELREIIRNLRKKLN